MTELLVGRKDEMQDGDRRLIETEGFEVGVYRHDGMYYAYRNVCLHQGGPVCEGIVIGKVEDVLAADRTYIRQRFDNGDPHIVCPWHGYEYRLLTGECAPDPRRRLKSYKVVERNEELYVVID